MIFGQKFSEEHQMTYAPVTGGMMILSYEGDTADLHIPDRIEDQPVVRIGEYAFENKNMKFMALPEGLVSIDHHAFCGCRRLERLHLPDSLKSIGNYAFYNCYSVYYVHLPAGLRSMGFGAFKNCEKLTEILQDQMDGNDMAVGGILDELSHCIHVEIHHLDEKTAGISRLTFTEHDYEAGEFTAAWNKQYDSAQIGSGKYMRYCVSNKAIDYHKYDDMFYVLLRGDPFEIPMTVALERLMFPYKLSQGAEARYKAYISQNEPETVKVLVRADRMEMLQFMADQGLLTEKGTDLALDLASELEKTEYISMLMDYRHAHFSSMEDEAFEL